MVLISKHKQTLHGLHQHTVLQYLGKFHSLVSECALIVTLTSEQTVHLLLLKGSFHNSNSISDEPELQCLSVGSNQVIA